jgi:tripartite-type tricarboxylate transporter receptor subunit TctC
VGTPEQLAAFMQSELARYMKLIKAIGLSVE